MAKASTILLSFLLVLGLLIVHFYTNAAYGIAHDEHISYEYGLYILEYYRQILSGRVENFFYPIEGQNYYPGLYYFIHVWLVESLPEWAAGALYEKIHLANALLGALGLLAVFLLGYIVGGVPLGALSLLLVMLLPRYMGEIPINPKDPPFAAAYALALATFLWAQHADRNARISALHAVVAGACFGILCGIRINGLVLAPLYLFYFLARSLRQRALPSVRSLLFGLLFALSFLLILAISWPYLHREGLGRLIESIALMSHYPLKLPLLFEGEYVLATKVPLHFTAKWYAIALPELHLLLLCLALCVSAYYLVKPRLAPPASWKVAWVVVAILLPLAVVLITRPTQYNGIRHTLFLLPPLCVYLAWSAVTVWQLLASQRILQRLLLAAFVILAAVPILETWRLFPYQYMYFNYAIAGGVESACQNYESEYWATSMPEALQLLDSLTEKQEVAIYSSYVRRFTFEPFLEKHQMHLVATPEEADYQVHSIWKGLCREEQGKISLIKHGCEIACIYPNERHLK